jgi:hypothetical protein
VQAVRGSGIDLNAVLSNERIKAAEATSNLAQLRSPEALHLSDSVQAILNAPFTLQRVVSESLHVREDPNAAAQGGTFETLRTAEDPNAATQWESLEMVRIADFVLAVLS